MSEKRETPGNETDGLGDGAREYSNLEHNVERAEDIAHRVDDRRDSHLAERERLTAEAKALEAQAKKSGRSLRAVKQYEADDLARQAGYKREAASNDRTPPVDADEMVRQAYEDYLRERRPEGPYDEDRARFVADRIRPFVHRLAQIKGVVPRSIDENGNRIPARITLNLDMPDMGRRLELGKARQELLYEMEQAVLAYDRRKHLG